MLPHLKGLVDPTRGEVERSGPVALLMQNPGDYLIHEHAREEAGEDALAAAGLSGRGEANPRDLSGVVIADGTSAEILAGGWHFSTEVARTLDGVGGALTPEEGARVIARELVA